MLKLYNVFFFISSPQHGSPTSCNDLPEAVTRPSTNHLDAAVLSPKRGQVPSWTSGHTRRGPLAGQRTPFIPPARRLHGCTDRR